MTPTPRTDAENKRTGWPSFYYDFARQLETDIAELNQRLIERHTDMLSTIVELRKENITMREVIKESHETSEIVNMWLKSCIECENWSWDADQHEAAKGSLDFSNQALAKLQPFNKS